MTLTETFFSRNIKREVFDVEVHISNFSRTEIFTARNE